MRRLLDWLVTKGYLDRWRGTGTWIGKLVKGADVRAVRRLARRLRERDR